jgi:hypothetical protein
MGDKGRCDLQESLFNLPKSSVARCFSGLMASRQIALWVGDFQLRRLSSRSLLTKMEKKVWLIVSGIKSLAIFPSHAGSQCDTLETWGTTETPYGSNACPCSQLHTVNGVKLMLKAFRPSRAPNETEGKWRLLVFAHDLYCRVP